MTNQIFKKLFKNLKRATILGASISSLSLFANPTLNCSLEMNQIDAGAPWYLVGDSNKDFDVTLSPMDAPYDNVYVAQQKIRFNYDQSGDSSRLSQHGVEVDAEYSEGNGLTVSIRILEFRDEGPNAKSKVLGAVGSSSLEMSSEILGSMNVSYMPSKIASLPKDASLPDLIARKVLVSGDLFNVGLSSCRFSE